MKLNLIALFALLMISLGSLQCKKNTPSRQVLTGKLIVNGPCDHYAIQLLNGSIDTANIEASWYDSDNGVTYPNAFSASNYCSFGNNGLKVGDTFSFQIDPNPMVQTCPVCMTAVAVPTKQNSVINVHKLN